MTNFFHKSALVCLLCLSSSALFAHGPQMGTAYFQTDSDSFELQCELDYVVTTPDDHYMGLVCDDPENQLNSNEMTGNSDLYQIEDASDSQLYTWGCLRKGRVNVSGGEFVAVIDCRSSGKPGMASEAG